MQNSAQLFRRIRSNYHKKLEEILNCMIILQYISAVAITVWFLGKYSDSPEF